MPFRDRIHQGPRLDRFSPDSIELGGEILDFLRQPMCGDGEDRNTEGPFRIVVDQQEVGGVPIEIRTIPAENLRITRFSGVISDAELVQYAEKLRDGFDPTMNGLIEMEATHLQISSGAVRTLAEAMKLPGISADRRVAILAPDDLAYGFGRMYEAIYEGPATVQVFRDRDAALQWVTVGEQHH